MMDKQREVVEKSNIPSQFISIHEQAPEGRLLSQLSKGKKIMLLNSIHDCDFSKQSLGWKQ